LLVLVHDYSVAYLPASNLAKRAHELEEQNNLLRQRNSSSPSDDDDTIQRLIVSIDRIRGEREEVKRQLEFLQAEHKFTQQQLDEERSSAQLNQSRSDALRVTAARTAQHLRSIRRLERQAHAFVTIFRHAQSSCEASDADARELHEQLEQLQEEHLCTIRDLQTEAQQLREELGYVQQDLADTRDELSQAQKELAETNLSFEDANTQRRELNIRLYDAQGSLNDTEHYMQDLQNQLVATKHDLESVLSERNSLHVHASNLEQEVEATKAELSEAEQRYSTLQAQQLATMSVEAIPKRLKLQIQELEERLTRRTKEKENLVHDVKRLETNMRLQEERLSEISTELETAQQENNAMIDDCAQTRDSRDHALRLVEDLEVEIDAHQVEVADLKAKIRETELSSQVSIRGLVLALANAAAKSRALTQTWRCALNGRRQAVTELSARLHLAEEENMRLLGSSTAAETRQREVASTAQRLASEGEVLRRDLLERSGELRSIVVVLALSHQHQRHQQSFVHDFRNARSAMRSRIETLQRGLDDHRTRLAATTAQLEESRRVQGESEALRTRHIELEDANTRLEHELAETKSVVDQKVDELAAHVSAHNALTDKFAELTDVHSRLRNEFDTTARTRAEETRELQDRLLAARTELESLQQSDDFDRQLADLRSEHSSALETLRLDLDRALAQTSAADASVRQATDARERIEKELASVRQEYQRQIDELTTDTRATHSLEQDLFNLRAVYDTHTAESKRVSDLANARIAELEAGLREAERLQSELQDQYQQTDRSLRTSLGELEVAKAALNEELEAKRAHIEEAASSNARWQEQIRESQATIMRLSSDANQSQLAQESLHATILER
jgi:chromosome segregation ATPase